MRDWLDLISSVERPKLGEDVPIVIFRAFRIFSGQYLKDIIGERGGMMLFLNAGRELGKELGEKLKSDDLEEYIQRIIDFVRDEKIGILIPERLDKEGAVLKLDECITCSGMPNIGERICHFEAGFVAGVFEAHLGKKVKATETKCNAMGEGVCEVTVEF